jgi:SAM-dependent methyltransferase
MLSAGWATRTAGTWVDAYAAIDQAHRQTLMRSLARFEPFTSVLEVGCGGGANLRLIGSLWPTVALIGLDVNPPLLMAAKAALPTATLVSGDMAEIPWPAADLVVSCYALAYVSPGQVPRVLGRLKAAARLGAVLMEPMPLGPVVASVRVPPAGDEPWGWAHPLPRMVAEPGWQIDAFPIAPPVDGLNRCLVMRRTG